MCLVYVSIGILKGGPMQMKIGILGGSFNPFHIGHYSLIEYAHTYLQLDYIKIVPTLNPPHKSDLYPIESRLSIISQSIKPLGNICHIDTSEIDSELPINYTYDTISKIGSDLSSSTETGLGPKMFFICGADAFLSIRSWYRCEELLGLATIAIVPRDGLQTEQFADRLRNDFKAASFINLPMKEVSASSTKIRDICQNSIATINSDQLNTMLATGSISQIRKTYCEDSSKSV